MEEVPEGFAAVFSGCACFFEDVVGHFDTDEEMDIDVVGPAVAVFEVLTEAHDGDGLVFFHRWFLCVFWGRTSPILCCISDEIYLSFFLT